MTNHNAVSTEKNHFFVTKEALSPNAASYVERSADRELYEALSQGTYAYVLTSSQMGKSSLMHRVSLQLMSNQIARTAIVDISGIGSNLKEDEWYGALLEMISREFNDIAGLREAIVNYWEENVDFHAPVPTFFNAITEVILVRINDPLVIFLDEIGALRKQSFSPDGFLAAIRACFNQRNRNPVFQRLTFCLQGIATPNELIDDVRTTPFNIGKRIELRDFTREEANVLAKGFVTKGRSLPEAQVLLDRVMYWTNGHPSLTQALCAAIVEKHNVHNAQQVDEVAAEQFFSAAMREQNDNLQYVTKFLQLSNANTPDILELYRRIWKTEKSWSPFTERIPSKVDSREMDALRLSGIIRSKNGFAAVRNAIYYKVFDSQWIEANLPDSNLRRLKVAFYRTGVLWSIISLILIFFSLSYANQTAMMQKALHSEKKAKEQAEKALEEARQASEDAKSSKEVAEKASEDAELSRKQQTEAQRQKDRAVGMAKTASDEATGLRKDIDQLRQEYSELQDSMHHALTERKKNEEQLAVSQNQQAKLQVSFNSLSQQKDSLIQKVKDLRDKESKLNLRIQEKERDLANVTKAKTDASVRLAQAEARTSGAVATAIADTTEQLEKNRAEKDFSYAFNLAQRYIVNKRYPDAIQQYMQMLKMRPDDYSLLREIGICYYMDEDYARAIFHLNQFNEKHIRSKPGYVVPTDEQANLYLAKSFYRRQEWKEASKALIRLENTKLGRTTEYYSMRGDCYFYLNQKSSAVSMYSQVVRMGEQDSAEYRSAKNRLESLRPASSQ